MKILKELLKDIEYQLINGHLDNEISGIFYDSRNCIEESLFIAVPGMSVDGHNFISQAIKGGAKTIIVSQDVKVAENITLIKIKDPRKSMAILGRNFYDNPSTKMKVVGITGTNGKTTTIHILKSIYENAGYKVGLIGTIGASIGETTIPCNNTTPESIDLQRILAVMVSQRVDYCFIEVSSHALALDRIYGTTIYAAMFTNLSPDHMEFHKDMEDYYNTKKKLFLIPEKFNIINIDDPWGKRLFEELKESNSSLHTFGLEAQANFIGKNIEYTPFGIKYEIQGPKVSGKVSLKIPGKVNVYNSLTAASFALTDNIPFHIVSEGIGKIKGVKGRFETVYKNDNYQVVIDFAHTEDGLKEVISSLRLFTKGRIILVFGVYAPSEDKGREKRLAMGRVASEYADILIVTSDNPKNQDPEFIIKEIIEGIKSFNNDKIIYSYSDRKEAIEKAISMVLKDDLILIAGKGHESAQIIGNVAVPFNEKEIVLETVEKNKNKAGLK